MTNLWIKSALIRFCRLYFRQAPAALVTLLILSSPIISQAQSLTCTSLLQVELSRDEKKIIDLLARLDAKVAAKVPEVLAQSTTELSRLSQLYIFLSQQAHTWSKLRTAKADEMTYIQTNARSGFEFIRSGTAEDVAQYRVNEITDLLYRTEDRIAEHHAEILFRNHLSANNSEIENPDYALTVLTVALREHNGLYLKIHWTRTKALASYRLFTPAQVAALVSLPSRSTVQNIEPSFLMRRTYREALIASGFQLTEASSILTAMRDGANKNRCCLKSCTDCTKNRGLKDRLSQNY